MTAAVRRHEQLAGEHQATVSQVQQLRAQNMSLAEQVLTLTSHLNTEKVKYEQQLRAARNHARKFLELQQHKEHLEQQVIGQFCINYPLLHMLALSSGHHAV